MQSGDYSGQERGLTSSGRYVNNEREGESLSMTVSVSLSQNPFFEFWNKMNSAPEYVNVCIWNSTKTCFLFNVFLILLHLFSQSRTPRGVQYCLAAPEASILGDPGLLPRVSLLMSLSCRFTDEAFWVEPLMTGQEAQVSPTSYAS